MDVLGAIGIDPDMPPTQNEVWQAIRAAQRSL
jgi:hypothetical protein